MKADTAGKPLPDERLVEILACPLCRGGVEYEKAEGIVCRNCRLTYEVRDGIPVMLPELAKGFRKPEKFS